MAKTLDSRAAALPLLAARLGAFAAATHYASLPQDVAQAVKLRILDTIAASASGLLAGNATRLLNLLQGDGPLPIWGARQGRGLRDAAIINSALAHSTYFEDGSRYTGGHPSSAVIPATMALAQARGASGRALLEAVAVGYEVFLRLGHAIYPSTVRRGFQSTAILAAPATAAAAANLLGLPAARAAHAVAIACSHGAGLKVALKSADSQPLQVGRSSEGGLLSAMYADQGATGTPDIFENGFLKAYADEARADRAGAGLGERWHIGETYVKVHGGCRGNHAPVDAVAALVRAQGVTASRIARLRVSVDTVTFAAAVEPPLNADQAQFSIGFSIAAMLVAGDATPARFTASMLADPRVRALMEKTDVRADNRLDAGYPDRRPAVVELTLEDGSTLRHTLDHALGEPENPMSPQDIVRKFETVAAGVHGAAVGPVRDTVLALEALPAAGALGDLLRGAS
ncbi:MmgE/PrpD family protein [Achromobacter aloeverae]|uniref:MmgE/PrpD family protein n=1 Tax=Achromobacter aloeverae TaxID=1750518 RepID=A0A4Q1HFS1_9BURK|nr:MmgE/PrpD family protein [Achromobacter aloeverae]RXN85965.1 hypothetical protein C7R54_19580 [Achromobacter aloeverae]